MVLFNKLLAVMRRSSPSSLPLHVTPPPDFDGQRKYTEASTSKPFEYTWKYYLEVGCFTVFVVYAFYWQASVLIATSDKYNSGELEHPRVRPGWFRDRLMDKSDHQWLVWRSNFPLLFIGLSVFLVVSNLIRYLGNRAGSETVFTSRILFYNIASVIVLLYLHELAAVLVYAIVLINFGISRWFGASRWNPGLTWVFNITVLFWASFNSGQFSSLMGQEFAWLDNYQGFLPWHVYFKITMLRLISHNMDYYWLLRKRPVPNLQGRDEYFKCQEQHLPRQYYTFWTYLAHVLYIPLYIAGPIVSYNAFISQVITPQRTIPLRRLVGMLGAVLFYMLCFEIAIHYIYHYAFNEWGQWREFPSYEVALTGYWVLNFMYHKFLIIWRSFRIAALFDGVDTPENMGRCVNNNFTFAGFWRAWHASFNTWTVRYLYVPLGGRNTQHLSLWLIFFFIGLWHDLWWRWVAWALLNCVFFSLEMLVTRYFTKARRWEWLRNAWYYEYVVSAAGGFDIILLMLANLAILHGFQDTPVFLYRAFVINRGPYTLLGAWVFLSACTRLMLVIRREEARRNAAKKY